MKQSCKLFRKLISKLQGQNEEGIALMRRGLAEYRRTGAEEQYGYFLLLLADRLAQAGRGGNIDGCILHE